MYGIIRSEPVSFQISLQQYTGRLVSLDNQISQKKFWFLPCRCDNPYIVIMWFVWIAGIEGKHYVGTLERGTGSIGTNT
jgi:hypothetical protein